MTGTIDENERDAESLARVLQALAAGDDAEVGRIQAWRIPPDLRHLYERRDVASGSVYGGSILTVVCRECGGCRHEERDGDRVQVIQHHEPGCTTPDAEARAYAARLTTYRTKVAAVRGTR